MDDILLTKDEAKDIAWYIYKNTDIESDRIWAIMDCLYQADAIDADTANTLSILLRKKSIVA